MRTSVRVPSVPPMVDAREVALAADHSPKSPCRREQCRGRLQRISSGTVRPSGFTRFALPYWSV